MMILHRETKNYLYARCAGTFSRPDPFLGSGTTLLAAITANQNSTGYEINTSSEINPPLIKKSIPI
ncbi:MAG: DNA methyltransferase [Thermodesulfobacteriota bacterium]